MNGYTGARDVEINSWYPDMNRNFAWEDTIHIRAYDKTAGLYRFDLSDVPGEAVVVQATFSVYATGHYGQEAVEMDVYQVNQPWQVDEATWNHADKAAGLAWELAGANGTPADRAAFPESQVVMSDTLTWYDFDVTNLARAWVADPATNHGLVLKSFDAAGGMWLACNEHGGADKHPKLTLRLDLSQVTPTATPTTTPTETPEPGRYTTTLQQGLDNYDGCQDTRILAWQPSENYGDGDILSVRAYDKMASLLRFDLSPLPARAEVITASLQVYAYYRESDYRTLNVEAYNVLRPWAEMAATWNQASAEIDWDDAGCNGENSDRSPWPAASVPLFDIETWYAFDVSPLVREWLAQPERNYGVVLKGFDDPQEFGLYSADHANVSRRPRLRIAYNLAEPSPTAMTTNTATSTPSRTMTATATATSSPTRTPLPTQTATLTLTSTATVTTTPTSPSTLTETPTMTPTPTLTATMTITPKPTRTATATMTITPTPSPVPHRVWLPLLIK
jgi:hypothetical protein